MTRYVLAAGGTGGHLFPAEALARELVARGGEVHVATDRRTVGFAADLPNVTVSQLRAGRFGGAARAAWGLAELALGTFQARRLLRRLEPAAVIGFGGYPSVPTMLAAMQLGFPTLIHEQNAVLGRANRLLARRAHRIATGFPETLGLRPKDRARAVHVGNPVRPEILAIGGAGYSPPDPGGPLQLLIVGGSQGAHVFGEIVPPALALLPAEWRATLRLAQQARPEDRAAVASGLAALGIDAEVESFFTDMPRRLARAHLVICRAGASTVAELAASSRPALLVPYPHATDDHQSANARAFAKVGGGWVVPQSALSPPLLASRLAELLANPAVLRGAAKQARGFAVEDAAERLAALVGAVAPGSYARRRERAA